MIFRYLLQPRAYWMALASVCLLGLACGTQRRSATNAIATGTPTPPAAVHSRLDDTPVPLFADAQSAKIKPARVATLLRTTRFIWPYEGRVSSYFGLGHPLGIDIAIDAKDETPIKASASGLVAFAGGEACCEYGYHVILDHDGDRTTLYAHLSRYTVSEGQEVAQGDVIGYSGLTGKTDGPHLHFEMREGETLVDPLRFLPKRPDMVAKEETDACDGTASTLAPDSFVFLRFGTDALPTQSLLAASLIPDSSGTHLEVSDNRPFEPLTVSFEEPAVAAAAGEVVERRLSLIFGDADTRTEVSCLFITPTNVTLPNPITVQPHSDPLTKSPSGSSARITPTPARNRPVPTATPIPTATPKALYSVLTPPRPTATASSPGVATQKVAPEPNAKPPTVAPTPRPPPKHFGGQ